jgi:hypothetical protein
VKYRHLCTNTECEVVTESVISMKDFKETIPCSICTAPAHHIFEGAPAVARAGMYNSPIDVAIGRDASMRWASIEERQQKRDKIRKESGKAGLTAIGYDQFKPITDNDKHKRTTAFQAAERDGFKAVDDF